MIKHSPARVLARAHLVFAGLLLLLLLLSLRTAWIQTHWSGELRDFAHRRITRAKKIQGLRGEITDRNGTPLAMSVPTLDVWVYTPNLREPGETAVRLGDILDLSATRRVELEKRLSEDRVQYFPVARNASIELADSLRRVAVGAITLEPSEKRLYPNGSLACQLLGFTSSDGRGLEGVERLYDKRLKPVNGELLEYRDGLGRPLAGITENIRPPRNGDRIVLTLDAKIQAIAEQELARSVFKFSPVSATAVVLDISTGDILAMVSYPAYDPNKRKGCRPEQFRCRVIADQYEPGSTFKSFILSSAIERGAITPDEPLFDLHGGRLRVGRRTLRDSHKPEEVQYPPWRIIAESSNIGAALVALHTYGKIPLEDLAFSRGESRLERCIKKLKISDAAWEFHADLKKFGFGEPTGVDFPGEVAGTLRPPQDWTRDSLLSVPMGQEICVTPLQLARAYAVIVNGGELLKPHVVLRVERAGGEAVWEREKEIVGRPISSQTAEKLREMLRGVVLHGRLKRFDTDTFHYAGKTGTAQVARNGRYASGAYVGSFCGFAPYETPRLLALVTIHEPDRKKGYYGATVAAPAVAHILRRSLVALASSK